MPKSQHNCAHCGTPYSRPASHLGRYCSRPCYDASRPSVFNRADWQARNREAQNTKKSEWRAANPEKRRQTQKKWRDANKDQIAASSSLRRAIYRTGATPAQVRSIMDAADGRCTYCDARAERLELDHVDPVAGGADHSLDNLLPACRTCNASKSDRPVEGWLFERFGIEGCARAIYMLENRQRLVLA